MNLSKSYLTGLVCIPILLSSCGTQPPQIECADPQFEYRKIDCRPYPMPTSIENRDIEPEPLADGWKLTHTQYMDVYQAYQNFESYMRQTREIARYFGDCIREFNRSADKLNADRE